MSKLRHPIFSAEISVFLCKVLISSLRLVVLSAVIYENTNKESEVKRAVCTQLENDWLDSYCYWFIHVCYVY